MLKQSKTIQFVFGKVFLTCILFLLTQQSFGHGLNKSHAFLMNVTYSSEVMVCGNLIISTKQKPKK